MNTLRATAIKAGANGTVIVAYALCLNFEYIGTYTTFEEMVEVRSAILADLFAKGESATLTTAGSSCYAIV